MLHPDIGLGDAGPLFGYGIFATAPIPLGTITWARDPLDRVLGPHEVEQMPEIVRAAVMRYAYVDTNGEYVLCWDLGRFTNHSCRPNTTGAGKDFDVALRDIGPGEEITCDYGNFGILAPFVCACGAPECRRVVGQDERDRVALLWADEVREALANVHRVAQPLLELARSNPFDRDLLDALERRRNVS